MRQSIRIIKSFTRREFIKLHRLLYLESISSVVTEKHANPNYFLSGPMNSGPIRRVYMEIIRFMRQTLINWPVKGLSFKIHMLANRYAHHRDQRWWQDSGHIRIPVWLIIYYYPRMSSISRKSPMIPIISMIISANSSRVTRYSLNTDSRNG